jgi:glycosyltransferase involved in cell wall biosynthesis
VAKHLPKLIESKQFDVIMAEWRGATGTAKAIKRCKKRGIEIKWVMEDRSPPAVNDIFGKLQWLHYGRTWRKIAKLADGISVLVPALEEYVRKNYGAEMKMVHCPSGVDIEKFYPGSRQNDTMKLLYHGSLYPERQVELLIKVGDSLAKIGLNFSMRIFGMGPSLKIFESAESSRPWLEVLGTVPRDDVSRLVRECHIGLIPWPENPSWQVGSPLKLFEYGASGLVAVVTDVRSHLEVAPRDWLTLVSNENLIDEMIAAILKISSDGNLSKHGISARQDIAREFTWAHATKPVHELLLSLLPDIN